MQLSFLGRTYEVFHPVVEVTETQERGTFLGQLYTRKHYQVEKSEQLEQPPEELIFMGQRYTRADNTLPCKPRPGEKTGDSRQMLQLQRSRSLGKRSQAFRSS